MLRSIARTLLRLARIWTERVLFPEAAALGATGLGHPVLVVSARTHWRKAADPQGRGADCIHAEERAATRGAARLGDERAAGVIALAAGPGVTTALRTGKRPALIYATTLQ